MKWLCLVCIVASAFSAQAQSWFGLGSSAQHANVVLSGNYRILGQQANRQGSFQEKPPDFARAEFTPTLIVFGLPVSASFLYSTEQGSVRQEINAFSLNLDPEALRRSVEQRAYRALDAYLVSDSGAVLQDYLGVLDTAQQLKGKFSEYVQQMGALNELREKPRASVTDYSDVLEQLGLMSTVEKIMLWMPKISYGTVFPSFTPLTLNGSRVSGLNVEWNPGDVVYINVVKGTTQRPLVRTDGVRIDTTLYTMNDQADYGREMMGARIGIGARDGAHLMFTGVYTNDNPNSVPRSDTLASSPPMRNIVGGLDFRVEPIPSIWTIDGEVAGSLTVGDLLAPKFSTDALPAFLVNLVDSSASAFADWSASAGTMINIPVTGTRLSGAIRRIGTGFRALGVPNMRVDVLRYDLKADQSLFQRQFSIGVFARRDQDNLVPLKRATTITTSMGANLGLTIRKAPYLRFSYLPYVQEANATDSLYAYENRTTMWNLSSGYSYRIGGMSATTQVNYSRQQAAITTDANEFGVTSINAYQSLAFTIPLNISVGGGYIEQLQSGVTSTIFTADATVLYSFDDILSVNAGSTLAFDRVGGDRIGYVVGITARIEHVADIDLRAERTVFDERLVPSVLGGSYQESILRLVISKSW